MKIYNKTKDISSLLDPQEISMDFIYYMARAFNIDIDTHKI